MPRRWRPSACRCSARRRRGQTRRHRSCWCRCERASRCSRRRSRRLPSCGCDQVVRGSLCFGNAGSRPRGRLLRSRCSSTCVSNTSRVPCFSPGRWAAIAQIWGVTHRSRSSSCRGCRRGCRQRRLWRRWPCKTWSGVQREVGAGRGRGEDDTIVTELHFTHIGHTVRDADSPFGILDLARGIGDVDGVFADAFAELLEAAARAARTDDRSF